ncbi:BCCT family transporter [Calidifontibacter sp. DB0510]|uniref:BCCT family transporter n=1 Tax=Metallococcus carri TaxID=1656884 RepID=A0A967E863_9MICO|nr:BCCT family transporter [Metallococcus carri]NHN54887.1 BCCT family transporter [Metallococcus carri]NOP37232.1 BCCT family transporter [Calidifontibacter sp. DB2511S]
MDKVLFAVTGIIAIAFVVWGLVSPAGLGTVSGDTLSWTMRSADWLFVLLASVFVVFAIWLAASRFGSIPLGGDNEKPEFSTISWVAMMFSAGMGIGLMFYGVSEPLTDFVSPVPDSGVTPQSREAMREAMATTLFHWTLHPWAIYAVVGIAIAYGTFRKGRTQLISSAFRSLLGRRVDGPIGKVIDGLAIFATLFGSSASLGLGALQISAGMQSVGWVDKISSFGLVAIIVVLTICFILSAVSGVARGIQWLSNINMVLALVLALFVFLVGPSVFILDMVPTALGTYAADLPEMASRTQASGDAALAKWLSTWTVFYWAWWISWTPFVGMFIARISRGRTIRQFVTGVLLVPSVVSLLWFAIFGGAAINQQMSTKDLVGKDGAVDANAALFQLLGHYPLATISTFVVMFLVAIFFVSGADAASIVMGTLSERGTIEPTRKTVIFWGVLTGAVAAVMLIVGLHEGDPAAALTSLQNITIVSALPFVIVMALMCWALVKDLREDPMMRRAELGQQLVEQAVIDGVTEHGHDELVLVIEENESRTEHIGGTEATVSRARVVDARPKQDADTRSQHGADTR